VNQQPFRHLCAVADHGSSLPGVAQVLAVDAAFRDAGAPP
jgi:hypothetical protein